MFTPRPSAWALIVVLTISLLAPAGAAMAVTPSPKCTGWADEFHPPTTIRVSRRSGPNAGGVEVVDFWTYVATVLRTEYSSGGEKGPLWMRVGAIAVKQYGWYYAMHWRGGKTADGTCYDVKDSTSDQIYHPERLLGGVWVPANVPTPANFQAMANTWHMTLQKWNPTQLTSRFFLTGYRSGKARPCGVDSTGFKILQKSLRDCTTKKLTLEETLRRYYEPNIELVDVRQRDVLLDDGQWLGDVGVLSANDGSTAWRLFPVQANAPGQADGFGAPVVGSFGIDPTKIISHGAGDVTGDNLSDLIVLQRPDKLRVAVATGTGYADPTTQDLPAGAPTDQMLVGDFDGDLIADVGLLRSSPTAPEPGDPATLVVMRGLSGGTFGAPTDWWRGALDLSSQQVMAADVNGDGKVDLIVRDGSAGVQFWVAPSFASCADFTTMGPCPVVPGTGLDVAQLWFDRPSWSAANIVQTTTDYNRDGRSDIVVIARDGSDIDVVGLTASPSGTFGPGVLLWEKANTSVGDVMPLGGDVNADGLGDLTLVLRDGANTALVWLRATSNEEPKALVSAVPTSDPTLAWNTGLNRPY